MIIIVPRFCQTSLHASTVSCVTKDFGKLVPQLDKHTQWETLSGLRLCPRGDLPLDGLLQCTLQKLSIQNHLSVLWPDLWNYSTDSPVKMSLSLWGGSSLRIWFQTSDLLPSGPVTKSDHKPFSQQPCQYKKSKDAQLSIIALLNVNENSLISVLTQCWPVISFQNDCWVVSGLNCYFIIVPKIVSVPRGTTGHCSVTNHKSSSNKYIQIQKEQREKKQKHWRFQDVDLRRFLRC